MKLLARAKRPKTSQRDFLVAHRYTICDGMCALRGVLQTAVACRGQSKGNTAFSLRCRGRTYPFAYFLIMMVLQHVRWICHLESIM